MCTKNLGKKIMKHGYLLGVAMEERMKKIVKSREIFQLPKNFKGKLENLAVNEAKIKPWIEEYNFLKAADLKNGLSNKDAIKLMAENSSKFKEYWERINSRI